MTTLSNCNQKHLTLSDHIAIETEIDTEIVLQKLRKD